MVRAKMARERRVAWRLAPERVLLGGLAALFVFAVLVRLGAFKPFDARMAEWISSLREPDLDALARTVTFFGSTPWLLIAGGLMGVWWIRTGRARLIGLLWGGVALGLVVQAALRLGLMQWRPDSHLTVAPASLWDHYDLAGFPSGHAFRSALLCCWGMEAAWRRRVWWVGLAAVGGLLLTAGVGITRLYLGRHWMTDVVGGWLVAMISYTAVRVWGTACAQRGGGQGERR